MKGCMTGEVELAEIRRAQGIKPRTKNEQLALVLLEYAEEVMAKRKKAKSKRRKKS